MKIIFSHTFRSIKKHIGQPLVIMVTVAIVTVLLFASLSMRDIFYNFQLARASRLANDTDIEIKGEIFSGKKLDAFIENRLTEVEYVDRYLASAGLIENEGSNPTVIQLEATDLTELLSRHKNKLVYRNGIGKDAETSHAGILIGKALSEAKGYSVGDDVRIYIGIFDRYETFTVTYIFENEGFFANSTVYTVMTDIFSLGDKGVYSDAFIKLKKGCDKEAFMRDLTEHMANPMLEIKDAIDYDYINNLVNSNEKLLLIALIFIISLVIFILFSAYTVVAKNRAEEMIVFKAAGATPLQVFGILVFEVLFYGFVGGIIGVITARFAMQIAVMNIIPMYVDAIRYSIGNYFIAILLGVVISLLGALIPIIRLTKKTVMNLSATGSKTVRKIPLLFVLIPVTVVIACVLCVLFVPSHAEIFTILMIVFVAGTIMISSPYIIEFVSYLFGKRKGILAAHTVKRNAEAVSLSCMLGVIITFVFIAVSLVNIIIDASTRYNYRFHSDYVVQTISGIEEIKEVNAYVEGTHGVDYTCLLFYDTFDMEYNGQDKDFTIYAVRSSADLKDVVTLSEEEEKAFDNESHAAVVSYDLMNRYQKRKGDKLNFAGSDYNFECRVVAVDETKTMNDRVVFVKRSEYDYVFENAMIFVHVKGNVPGKDLYTDLKQTLSDRGYFVLQFDEWANAAGVGISGIGTLLRFLQFLVGFVGFIGIINMTMALLMSRNREFGIYRSSGMDQKKYKKLLLVESLEISIGGSVIGTIFSIVINFMMPSFAGLIDRYINIGFPWTIPVIAATVIALYCVIYVGIGASKKVERFGIERNLT